MNDSSKINLTSNLESAASAQTSVADLNHTSLIFNFNFLSAILLGHLPFVNHTIKPNAKLRLGVFVLRLCDNQVVVRQERR